MLLLRTRPALVAVLLTGALLLAWDFSGLDLVLAHWTGSASGFAWRDHVLLSTVLHSGARALGWVLLLALMVGVVWPVGVLRQLNRTERTTLVASIWLALLAVVLIKGFSTTSCPWDLQAFGGTASYVSHWRWGVLDGGGGHCFPAGHASTAFAFLPGALWLWPHHRVAAKRWLWTVLVAGAVLGLAQQVRGAHFMSHTLWTAWICATVSLLCYQAALRLPAMRPAHKPSQTLAA